MKLLIGHSKLSTMHNARGKINEKWVSEGTERAGDDRLYNCEGVSGECTWLSNATTRSVWQVLENTDIQFDINIKYEINQTGALKLHSEIQVDTEFAPLALDTPKLRPVTS